MAGRIAYWQARRGLAALAVAVACCAGCAISPWNAEWRQKSDALLVEQQRAFEQAKAPAGRKVFLAAFAMHSESAAFQGDIVRTRDALRSIDGQLPAFMLSNNLEHVRIEYPFATRRNIRAVLASIARRADKDSLVVVLFSSHGSQTELAIHAADGDYKETLPAPDLRDYLQPLADVPTVIVISACYSGAFVPFLAAENRIIMTSAARDRSSFGCNPVSTGTYFIQELFPNDLDPSLSLVAMFRQASERVAEREKRGKLIPSRPQLFVGKGMAQVYKVPLRELLTTK